MQEVELHQAWMFTCDSCGRDNYVRSIAVNFNSIEEKEAAFREVYQLDPFEELPEEWDRCECFTCPSQVECDFCDAVFKAIGPGHTDGESCPD